jgi:hypothetical protein
MTLCAAWIREINGVEELVLATDSMLTGGEKWDRGIKLFELSRKDCLLCFAGATSRAYPLILNFISSIKFDKRLENVDTSITDLLDSMAELFTQLIKTIVSEISGEDIHELRAEANFLFGGWDWLSNSFRVWRLYYSKDVEGFLFNELTNDNNKTRFYTFMGDASVDIEKEAYDRFKHLLIEKDKLDSKLDMEPLEILSGIALDTTIREVGGSLQIAKVYKSGNSEFFGVIWPSSSGKPFFQGREYNNFTKAPVKYFNPDTFEILDWGLPEKLPELPEEIPGYDLDFLRECYPDGKMKISVSEKEKIKIKTILKEIAYYKYLREVDKEEAIESYERD